MSEPLINWLNAQQENMLSLMADLVNIDSNSFDKAGVDKVAARLRVFFDNHRIPYDTIPLTDHGDALRAVVSGGDGNKPILLCCLLYTSPSPRDEQSSRMPSSA